MEDSTQERTLIVIGDLHFEKSEEEMFLRAHAQISALSPDVVISLGDLGGYSHCGTRGSFEEGLQFLSTFNCPFYAVLGNHDFEGPEFSSDEASIRAWCEVLGAPAAYQAIDLGPALGVCLSQTEYRSNLGTQGEIHLDATQIAWLSRILSLQQDKPIFIFSHAPILGSGLRVLQDIHLRNPNAWLNHADGATQFMPLVRASPEVRLWFSAHNHLGQDYPDSVTTVNGCTFVHVGIIGSRSRDGKHQSRVVKFDSFGWRLYSLDHLSGELRSDFNCLYGTGEVVRLFAPTESAAERYFPPLPCPVGPDRLEIGRSVFRLYRGMLVEYDADLAAPLGVVAEGLTGWLITRDGDRLVARSECGDHRIFERTPFGRFFTVFAPNPFLLERESHGRTVSTQDR